MTRDELVKAVAAKVTSDGCQALTDGCPNWEWRPDEFKAWDCSVPGDCPKCWATAIVDLVESCKEPYHPLAEQLETGHA